MFTGEAPDAPVARDYALLPTAARYLKVRLLGDHYGLPNRGQFNGMTAWTRPRDGGALSLHEAGVAVTASSESATAHYATDLQPTTVWTSGASDAAPTLTVDLPGEDWHVVDRVRIRNITLSSFALRNFEIWASSTTDAPGDFVQVATGQVPATDPVTETFFFFAPFPARYVQLRAIDNVSGGTQVSVSQFQVFTAHEGGLTVPFQDRTTLGANPIVWWNWDFGDGTRSALPSPTHTFPGPGTYLVTLEVIDEYGLPATAEYVYSAHAGPDAFFTYAPDPIEQGNVVTFTDRSVSDVPLARVEWTIDGASPVVTAPGGTRPHTATQVRPFIASITATDAWLLRSTYTEEIPVENLPPSVDVGADQTVVWGETWLPVAAPDVSDASAGDWFATTCVLDFDDGTVTPTIDPCTDGIDPTVYVPHAWSTPGTYEVVVTATDPSGATGEDRFFVEVTRRPTVVGIDAVPGAEAGGPQLVTVRLADAYDPGASMAGRGLELRLGAQVVAATTDATGAASGTLDFTAGASNAVEVRFAGDTLYFPSSHAQIFPEALAPTQRASCGREFLLAIPQSCFSQTTCPEFHRNTLFLTSTGADTFVEVDSAYDGWHGQARVPARGVGQVQLPFHAEMFETGTAVSRSVRIRSTRDVCAVVMSYIENTTDAYLALPITGLGREYVASSFGSNAGSVASQITVTGTADATSVTIIPTAALLSGADVPTGTAAGVPFVITLDEGETIQLRPAFAAASDLTGTRISATEPVAVAAGHSCANVPFGALACDYLVEQIPPVDMLGTEFLAAPFSSRASGYLLRVAAAENGTEVTVDGTLVATLAAGAFHEINVTDQTVRVISSNHPVLVTQYAKGSTTDGAVGDPFQLTLVPTDRFGREFGFSTIPDYETRRGDGWEFLNHVTVIARAGETGGVRLDGAPIASSFTAIGSSGWAYAHVPITSGDHRLQQLTLGGTIGAYVYGWRYFESYGYPAFMRLVPSDETCAPIATVPGNAEDDDCDGLIDEEEDNGIDDDGDGLIDEDLEYVEGTPPNVAPVAYAGAVGTREDQAVAFVLSAFDVNGDALTYEIVTSPTFGALTGTGPAMTYTPDADQHGTDSLAFRVCDATECSEPATVTITVRSVNDPPAIDMQPFISAYEDALLTLPCVADEVDVDVGCDLTWELLDGPEGMTIDPLSGDLYWVPGEENAAQTVSITVRVTDCHGASSTFSFGVGIQDLPDAPVITSAPVRAARFNTLYEYDVEAVDPDPGDTATFQLLEAPAGMTIVTATGVISWTPTTSDAGPHTVRVVAIDTAGLTSHPQVFEVLVAGDGRSPVVTVAVDPPLVLPGETATITVTVTDDDSATIDSVTVDGTAITMVGNVGTYSTATPGVYPVVATASDPTGNIGIGDGTVRVRVVGDDAPPVVDLTAPAPDALLTYLHAAEGSVFDDNLHRYSLAMRRTDHGSWFEVASGTANVTGALGTIDTTQMENGVYHLRLRAEDVNGQIGEDTIAVRVDGGAKVGVVQLAFTDLVMPDFGIPLAVVRRYDSRVQTQEDFGVGWSLEMRHGSVQHNRPPGEWYSIHTREGDLIPCTRVEEQEYHFTEVRISETEWYLFRPTIVNIQPLSGGCSGEVVFEQVDGTRGGAELISIDDSEVRASAIPVVAAGTWSLESHLTVVNTGELYDPDDFQLRLADGRIFDLNRARGIVRAEDRHGNMVWITDRGMIHSSGRGMHFVRDAEGRITQIIDGSGRSVGYEYDGQGNLIAFIDVLGRRTRYEYRVAWHPHHLTDIVDWRGVRVAALEYHDDGRLERLCDAEGICAASTYDLTSRAMTQLDGLGRPTIYSYDERGNVERIIDALGNQTQFSYDLHDRMYLREDPTGAQTGWGYDAWTGDRLFERQPYAVGEDPEDFTTRWTYESHGQPITERLPTGGTHHFERDANGDEIALRDDAGRVVRSRTYNPDGTVATYTDRFGTRTYEYGPHGRPTRVTDPHGRVFVIGYNPAGEVASVESGGVTMRYAYDALGRRLFADYGRGITLRYEYDGNGNEWTAIEGPSVGRVERRFSGGGRLIGWTLPNGDTFSRTYDALGRVTESVDEMGNATVTTYDDAGRVASITDVGRAATRTFVRDGNGTPLQITDPEGHVVTMTRDPRGGLATYIDGRSQTWTFANGSSESSTTTPTGDTTTSARGPYGLPTGQTLPGGATTSVAHAGDTSLDESYRFPLTRTDEAGRARAFTYDAMGGLDTASDLGGDAWAYDYGTTVAGDLRFDVESGRVWVDAGERVYGLSASPDEVEELEPWSHALTEVTSPEGELTRWSRDSAGRIDLAEYPHGGTEVRTYASDGQLATVTLPHGTTLEYDTDVAGRVLERTGTDGSLITYSYAAGDRVSQHSDATGITTHHHDSVGRSTGLTQPTGASVRFGRDRLDRIDAVRVREPGAATDRETEYVYDAAGNVSEIHDPLGGITTMTYDAAGRLATRTLANGVLSTWAYDARGRITSITHATGAGTVLASVAYVRAPSGEPTRITREDGTYVEYGYDAALRLERETYYDAADAQIDEITYAYDQDGNRTRRTTSAGEEVYAYGSGSRLTDISVGGAPIAIYGYDGAGRVTTLTRGTDERVLAWDADDHVTSIARGTDEVVFDFDAQGRRVRAERRTTGVPTDAHRYVVAPTLAENLESPHMATTDAGVPRVGWVFQGEHPLFRYDPTTGDAVYYLVDSMGSVIGLVDDAATTSSAIHYDAFGNERATTGTLAALPAAAAGDFRFQGMWLDQGTGLYYVRARSYETETGRFLSRDPALATPTHPESLHPYAFTASAPTVYRDPTGYASLMDQMAALWGRVRLQFTTIASGGAAFLHRMRHHADAVAQAAARGGADLGRKLEYILGNATGSLHNVQRSVAMAQQLSRIGLSDNPTTRSLLTQHLSRVLYDPSNIIRVERTTHGAVRIVRESLLVGPHGLVKLETVWEGPRLITMFVFGG